MSLQENPRFAPDSPIRVCIVLAILTFFSVSAGAQTSLNCPQRPSSTPGLDFRGQTLTWRNFSRQDLTNANFEGATLTGAVFIGANLTGANFRNATFADSNNLVLPTDFTFANLTSACFIGARFNGPTHFTYATLTSTDFSETNITAHAVFGPSPLTFDPNQSPRPAFRSTQMNCEFIYDWRALNLASAILGACAAQLAGHDFSGSDMAGVDFSNQYLAGTTWVKANLSGATFNGAILTQAVFSGSKLYGAQFSGANLAGAKLDETFLTNKPEAGIHEAANLSGAYLKNADFSNAQLSGANLSNASFYSSLFSNNGAATATGATMNNTQFAGAYLYGVDFSGTTIQGVNFANAVLVGANFRGASLSTDPDVGTPTSFSAAFLQGARLEEATLNGTSLVNAFVDFSSGGNLMHLLLDGTHTTFPGRQNPGNTVCLEIKYGQPTTVPKGNTTLTCPDHSTASTNNPSGCGPEEAATPPGCGPNRNTHWQSCVDISHTNPRASYSEDATYTLAASPICPNPDFEWSE